ncbi:MAG: hypothetical protein HXY46_10930 [Syntrophaceae bacterium]|nr:hypothetical protein [Syntrophaceae bacterium]
MVASPNVKYACEHCGAEADMIVEGFESVQDVIEKKRGTICKHCGKAIETFIRVRKPFACEHCGAEADMSLEGIEKVEDVVKRYNKLTCDTCGKDIPWTVREDLKAIEIAMKAEKEASQSYSKAAKMTKNPKGKDMFQQLSEFEMNHYKRLKELSQSLQEKGEWMLYSGTSLKRRSIPLKMDKLGDKEQLTDMDALRIAIREEKKAQAYYRLMAELARDARGKDMYKRLAEEEALHEKILNDQYYSLHNTGVWSWGD